MADDPRKRIYKSTAVPRGVSERLPFPNIVRIEQLAGENRQRYLGTFKQVIDKARDAVRKDEIPKIFYGYLDKNSDTGFGMGAEWASKGSSVFGTLKGMAGSVKGIGKVLNSVADVAEGMAKFTEDLLQINTTATGGATVKEFTSPTLPDPMSLK
jgi:hypothetical protein